jgi:NAD(P)-dependent dehydrogenase (short-subunit alcohol dehydrogenase family)
MQMTVDRSRTARAVVVTGASSGIGYETARTLARRGFRVFGTIRRDADAPRLHQSDVVPITMDVTDRSSIETAATQVRQQLAGAPLCALINNAGIPAAGPVESVPVDEWRAVFETNVIGAVAVTQVFLPLLIECKGMIVNISSVSGSVAPPFVGPYAASKAALEALSDSLRRELYPTGVRVVVIQPGSIETPIWDKVEAMDLRAWNTRYGAVLARVREDAVAGGRRGLPAQLVADAVFRVIRSANPPTRVRVVRARFKSWLSRILPDKIVDRMVARRLWRSVTR